MKKAKLLIALLVLLGAASVAEAQIVVSSTTASTYREKTLSGREKGLVIRPEVELGKGPQINMLFGINGTIVYQFNPYFAIGGGIGYDYQKNIYDKVESNASWMPIFFNARAYFCDRKWSPFFDVKIGYNIPVKEGVMKEDYGYRVHTTIENIQGFSIGGTLGVQYKGFDIGVTGHALNYLHIYENISQDGSEHNTSTESWLSFAVTLSVAYNFQFNK